MTTNFTFRDFFVYLLTGLTLIVCLGIIFIQDIFNWTLLFLCRYDFITDFSFLWVILLIPTIYLLGHIVGSISYNLLKIYVWIDNKCFKRPIQKWKYNILIKIQQLIYRQRVVYAIIKYTKSNKELKPFKNVEEFWLVCAKLQIEKIYEPAEYWYVLNELFNSINLIFFISMIVSFMNGLWILGLIYFVLTIFAFKRARQYADQFVKTVHNLIIAKQTAQ